MRIEEGDEGNEYLVLEEDEVSDFNSSATHRDIRTRDAYPLRRG